MRRERVNSGGVEERGCGGLRRDWRKNGGWRGWKGVVGGESKGGHGERGSE